MVNSMDETMDNWIYVVTPGFVARYQLSGVLEIRHLKTGEWMPKQSPDLFRSVEEDGSSVTEAQADKIFQDYQKRFTSA
jgi:hypothetical protein